MTTESLSVENLTSEDFSPEVPSSEALTMEKSKESTADSTNSMDNISLDLSFEDNMTSEDTKESHSKELSLERLRRRSFSGARL